MDQYREMGSIAQIAESSSEKLMFGLLKESISTKGAVLHYVSTRLFGELHGSGGIWLLSELEGELAPSEQKSSGNKHDNFTSLPHDLKNTPEGLVIAAINSRSLAIDTVPWNERINNIAKLYITSGRGEEKLKELTDTATQFRINFQKGFKLEDLLLASEKRLRAHRVGSIYKDRAGPV